jgi:hypothetical protein
VASKQAKMAQPEPPVLKDTPPGAWTANQADPAKPSSKPSPRQCVGRSFNHNQAIKAPNKGVVAFKMDDKPVLSDCNANAKQKNGTAELNNPMPNKARHSALMVWAWCCQKTRGNKVMAATDTRIQAVDQGPNSCVAMSVKKKEDPQIMPNNTNSGSQSRRRKPEVTRACPRV